MITNKEKPFTANLSEIERLTSEISKANVSPLVIVHGGGSFGHPVAKQYEIDEGYKDSSQVIGFAKTHQAMTKLNKLIVDSLINHNIEPMIAMRERTRITFFLFPFPISLLNFNLQPEGFNMSSDTR